jgi:major type 1 subunit fimbrin (pilin)
VQVVTPSGNNLYPISAPYDSEPTPGIAPIYMHWRGPPLVQYRFIKTGPVAGGTIRDADLPTVRYSLDHTLDIFRGIASGINLTFATLACASPDVVVDMGTAKKVDFAGVGSRTATRSFDIELLNCPVGLNGIRFSLAAPNGIADTDQGVFALAPGSTANGVGIQVRYGGSPVKYDGTRYAYGGYSGAGSYRIPFEASYYQTQPTINSGSANGQLEFTMSYE